jgi:putative transposase
MKNVRESEWLPQRKSLRLQHYDYSQNGAYFITICSYNREYLFGDIVGQEMVLNKMGLIVQEEWAKSAKMRTEIKLDEFVVMPNHFHAIFFIDSRGDRPVARVFDIKQHSTVSGPKNRSVSSLIGGFKAAVTARINEMHRSPGTPVWQRNYHEHIIRDEKSLEKIRDYIAGNPANWQDDQLNKLNR